MRPQNAHSFFFLNVYQFDPLTLKEFFFSKSIQGDIWDFLWKDDINSFASKRLRSDFFFSEGFPLCTKRNENLQIIWLSPLKIQLLHSLKGGSLWWNMMGFLKEFPRENWRKVSRLENGLHNLCPLLNFWLQSKQLIDKGYESSLLCAEKMTLMKLKIQEASLLWRLFSFDCPENNCDSIPKHDSLESNSVGCLIYFDNLSFEDILLIPRSSCQGRWRVHLKLFL